MILDPTASTSTRPAPAHAPSAPSHPPPPPAARQYSPNPHARRAPSWRGSLLPSTVVRAAARHLAALSDPAAPRGLHVLLAPHGRDGLRLANAAELEAALLLFSAERGGPDDGSLRLARAPPASEMALHAKLPLLEQAELFARASAVVALHGPQLSLLLFAPPATPILEIGVGSSLLRAGGFRPPPHGRCRGRGRW